VLLIPSSLYVCIPSRFSWCLGCGPKVLGGLRLLSLWETVVCMLGPSPATFDDHSFKMLQFCFGRKISIAGLHSRICRRGWRFACLWIRQCQGFRRMNESDKETPKSAPARKVVPNKSTVPVWNRHIKVRHLVISLGSSMSQIYVVHAVATEWSMMLH
jgi:hypothetical protein